VGRPDLLETAAGLKGTMESGAKDLYRSLQKLNRYPAHLLVWPGHGAGSACGKSLGGVPVTTLGYECATNWALNANSEKSFVEVVLDGQPDPPRYFREMKRINKEGPATSPTIALPLLGGPQFVAALEGGSWIVDIRSTDEVAAGFAAGTLHIPSGRSFTTWAGWLLPYGPPIYLLAESDDEAEKAKREMGMIGLDDVRGWFGPDALKAYEDARGDLEMVQQITSEELIGRRDVTVLDVRSRMELEDGQVPGSINIPLGELQDRIDEVPRGKSIVVHCASGFRSPMAVSILRRSGFEELSNLVGGYAEYQSLVGSLSA
jgi:hydroxyacylglutathione hydrolase